MKFDVDADNNDMRLNRTQAKGFQYRNRSLSA